MIKNFSQTFQYFSHRIYIKYNSGKDENIYLLPNIKMAKETPTKEETIPVIENVEVEEVYDDGPRTSKEIIDSANANPQKDTTAVLGIEWINSLTELTPEQEERKLQFKESLNIEDTTSIIEYWAQQQEWLKEVVEKISRTSKSKQFEVIWKDLMDLKSTLRKQWESQGWWRVAALVRRFKEKVLTRRDWNMSLEENITSIEGIIKNHLDVLTDDIASLEELREINKDRFYELQLLRKAWSEKVEEMKVQIAEKKKEFEESDWVLDEMEKQTLAKMTKSLNLLEKKLYDLYQSQMLAVQTAAQIHMIKCNDIQLKELMQETVLTSIPIRRMQWALSVATENAQMVADTHRAMSDATNQMLKQNAEMLWTLSVDVANEAERPVLEVETLEHVFVTIWKTIDQVAKITAEKQKERIEWQKKLEAQEQKIFWSDKQIEEPKGKKRKK